MAPLYFTEDLLSSIVTVAATAIVELVVSIVVAVEPVGIIVLSRQCYASFEYDRFGGSA